MLPNILIIDDEKNTRDALEQILEDDYEVFCASGADEAIEYLKREKFAVILTDLRMAGKSGLDVIDFALKRPYQPECIMMTAYGSVETAVEALKHGAFDFITKPIDCDKFDVLIKQAIAARDKKLGINQTKQPFKSSKTVASSQQIIIGNSEKTKNILEKISKVAKSSVSVLICGETGTGKELFANEIHSQSERKGKFIAIHCAALPKNLIESELFGHEKGSFTGANSQRAGYFEMANNGTIFLDEIGEIDLATQVKLLRFLETHSFFRVGGSEPVNLDVRIIAATNKNLETMVAEKTFREDLYYRLSVIRLDAPALRERTGDIETLLECYINKFSEENCLARPILTKEVTNALQKYKWPGNIRELKNFCESTVILYAGENITIEKIDAKFLNSTLV